MSIKQAVILCGGRGQRLTPYTNKIPKPMIKINNKPFLSIIMHQLSKNNIKNFVLLIGYKGEKIKKYFRDGKQYGWKINYSHGPDEWDTGKRVFNARKLFFKNFYLLYSDNFINFNIKKIEKKHLNNIYPITLLLVKKNNGNISLTKKMSIKYYDPKKIKKNLNFVELGYMAINKKKLFLNFKFKEENNFNFSKILEIFSRKKMINNILIDNQYQSISDPKRYEQAKIFFKNKKIIFLDRDGVINHKVKNKRYVEKWSDFSFIDENVEALEVLSKKGFKFIIITNQAGISLNIIKRKTLSYIHNKMKSELLKKGIEILDIFYSPDHFNDTSSKTRKPAPGLFFMASQIYKVNLLDCLFIGDDPRDCLASYNAGFNSIFLGKKNTLKFLNNDQYPLKVCKNIKNSIKFITQFYK